MQHKSLCTHKNKTHFIYSVLKLLYHLLNTVLFSDTVPNADIGRRVAEWLLGRDLDVVTEYFKVLTQLSSEETEENHKIKPSHERTETTHTKLTACLLLSYREHSHKTQKHSQGLSILYYAISSVISIC